MIIYPPTLPPLNKKIVQGMQLRFPIIENPQGSNLSPEITAMQKRWGSAARSPWCALLTTDVWYEAGADVPPALPGKTTTGRERHPAVAEWWRVWALEQSLFSSVPVIGAAPLFGTGGREPAVHIGVCITAIEPRLMGFEGNTTGAPFDREGTMTAHKDVNRDRLIGYVLPRLRA